MKMKNIVWGAVLMAVISISCNEDNGGMDDAGNKGDGVVRFNSMIQGVLQTKVNEQTWETGDEVGIFMCGVTGNNLTGNKKYLADRQGELTVAEGAGITYPESGNVKFYAYYPYQAGASDFVYKVNVSENKDLVWVVTDELEASENPVTLLFSHQLAKIELIVKAGAGVSSLEGLDVQMSQMFGTADFDLKTGALSGEMVGGDVNIAMKASGNDKTGSVIIIPCNQLADAAVTFSLNGASFKWNLADKTFNPKTKYTYTITLTQPEGGEVSASFGTATIGDWTDKVVKEETLTGNETPVAPKADFGQPELQAGVLKAGVEVAGTTITLPYTNGEGITLKNVSAEVSGVAAGGIQVATQTNVALLATGTITLQVSGTPLVAGNVSFTVKVNGETVGVPLTGTVEQGESGEGLVLLSQDFTDCTAGPAYPASASAEFSVATLGAGWSGVKVYSAVGMIKLGSGSAKGSITTPELSKISGTKDVQVSFDIAGWPDKNPQVAIVVDGGGVPSVTIVEGYKNDGTPGLENRTFNIVGATATTTVKIEAKNASNNQFFLDNIKITEL